MAGGGDIYDLDTSPLFRLKGVSEIPDWFSEVFKCLRYSVSNSIWTLLTNFCFVMNGQTLFNDLLSPVQK